MDMRCTSLMPRAKRENIKRMPIDLDLDDPQQKQLWDHWLALAANGKASQWVRDILITALPGQTLHEQRIFERPAAPKNERPFTPVPKPDKGK